MLLNYEYENRHGVMMVSWYTLFSGVHESKARNISAQTIPEPVARGDSPHQPCHLHTLTFYSAIESVPAAHTRIVHDAWKRVRLVARSNNTSTEGTHKAHRTNAKHATEQRRISDHSRGKAYPTHASIATRQ